MASYRTHSLKDFIQILFNSQGGSEETDIWIYGVLKLKTYFCRPVYVDNYIPSFLSRCESNQSFFFFLHFNILHLNPRSHSFKDSTWIFHEISQLLLMKDFWVWPHRYYSLFSLLLFYCVFVCVCKCARMCSNACAHTHCGSSYSTGVCG